MVEVVGAHGPAFIWTHGILASRAQEDDDGLLDWRNIVDQDWRWVRYDLRGHGESTGTTNVAAYSWREAGRDLVELANALNIPRFAGGGVSTGCAALLEAALEVPDRIDRLILVLPPAAWAERPAQVERYQNLAATLRTQGVAEWAATARPPIVAAESNLPPFRPRVPDEYLPSVLRGSAASDLPDPERIAQLPQPTLILAWDTDESHPLSTAQQLAELLPRAELNIARTLRQVYDWPHLVSRFIGHGS
jgi:3-oxoadipate enol-lactonase